MPDDNQQQHRYDLRDRKQIRPPIRQRTPQEDQTGKQQPKPRTTGAHRIGQTELRETPPSLRKLPKRNGRYELWPYLEAMGYEMGGSRPPEDEEDPELLPTLEEVDPGSLQYTWPLDTIEEIDDDFREQTKDNPFISAWVMAWDNMRERMRLLEAQQHGE